jgi:hypothetical protein
MHAGLEWNNCFIAVELLFVASMIDTSAAPEKVMRLMQTHVMPFQSHQC